MPKKFRLLRIQLKRLIGKQVAGWNVKSSPRPIEVVVASGIFSLLGVISVVYGLDYVFVQAIRGGYVGVVFGIIDFVVAWLIFNQRKTGGSLGLLWAFVGILAEFILPLVFKGFADRQHRRDRGILPYGSFALEGMASP